MRPALFLAIRLAKSGFCGGDPEAILHKRTDVVIGMMEYLNFTSDYEDTWAELNRKEQS